MRTKPINSAAVNFLLSSCCRDAFNFTFWSYPLKMVLTIFSKPRVLFCRGVNLLVSWSWYRCLWSLVGRSCYIEEEYNWLASIPTIDLQMLVDFRIKVSTTTALRVETIEGPPTTSSWISTNRCLLFSVKGQNIVSVDLCKKMLTKFGNVQPSFNILTHLLS